MFRSKKIASFLSVLTVFAVVAGSFPIQAFAELYTGELVLPNTTILPDYGGGYTSVATFNNSYFPSAPTFSARESNNFITSLPQKVFSISTADVLDCDENELGINASNNSIGLVGARSYSSGDNDYTAPFLCQPTTIPSTAQNTVLTNTGSGNSYGGLGVVQTYDAIPLTTLGESAQTTIVESIPNDPNNVRVTVSENVTQEAYGLHFERRGDVERVLDGDYRLWFPDNGFYEDGKTYVINWTSNWVGQVPINLGCDNESGYCNIIWGDPSTALSDDDSGRTTFNPLLVNTGYPTPQIVQLASIAPALVSSSIVRPRNSDILSVTQPVCTRWSDGNFWRTVQHVYCLTDGLSADGRTGHAIYYDSVSSSGWFQEFLGVSLAFVGLATLGGADFGFFSSFISSLGNIPSISLTAQNISNLYDLYYVFTAASTAQTLAVIIATTAGVVAAMIGPTALGTVENSGSLGVGDWTWSTAPEFQNTTADRICANGSPDWPTCPETTCTNGATNYPICGCTNGATNYPVCSITIFDTDLCTNIDGMQTSIPEGYTRDASGNCNTGDTDTDTDLCLNIAGMQTSVPAGYTRNASGNCYHLDPADDRCANIPGIQSTVPAGYTRDASGNCNNGGEGGAPEISSWQVVPTLVRSGEPTFVSWTTRDVSSCTVSSTNGDSWSGASWRTGTREQSLPILGQTIFSITCTTSSDTTVSTSTKTVNIIPTFQER